MHTYHIHPYFSEMVLPSGQKLTSGLFATITLEVACVVRCRDATASSFVAKFRREVIANFLAVAVKHLGSIQI
jgi:hypothetical protein